MKRLIDLANKLDKLGLVSEANAVDGMIKKSESDDFDSAGWPNPGTSADIDRGSPSFEYTREGTKVTYPNDPGQGETILEGDVPEGEEPSVGGSTMYVVMYVAQGEGGSLRGVYSSRENAEKAIEAADDSSSWGMGDLEVQEVQLDSTEQIEAY